MRRLAIVAAMLLVASTVFARDDKPAGKLEPVADQLAEMIQALNHKKVKFDGGLKGMNLRQLTETLEKQFGKPVKFVVREDLFRATGNPDLDNIKEKQFQNDTNLSDTTLHDFLRVSLAEFRGHYLVRKSHIEIVPVEEAARQFDREAAEDTFDPVMKLQATPLANAVFQERPLTDVLAELERVYDRTILMTASATDLAKTPVTARLLNVPLSSAVQELAEGVGLHVKETGGMIVVSASGKKKAKK